MCVWGGNQDISMTFSGREVGCGGGGANNAQGFVGELEGSSDPESLDRNLSCTSEGLLLLFCMEFLLVWKYLM